MIYFYVFQATSLVVSLSLLPIYLHYFSDEQYSVWMIFTYSALLSVNLQASVQNIWSRRISMKIVKEDDPIEQIKYCRSDYTLIFLISISAIGLFTAGYFFFIDKAEYIHLCLLYLLCFCYVYLFSHYFVTLLSQGRLKVFYLILSLTRSTQLLISGAFFYMGAGLYSGIAAIAISNLLGILLVRRHSDFRIPALPIFFKHTQSLSSYLIAPLSFGVYYLCFIIFFNEFSGKETINFGLFFQFFLLLYAVTIMPSQVLVRKMSEVIVGSVNVLRYVFLQTFFAGAIFVAGVLFLIMILDIVNFFIGFQLFISDYVIYLSLIFLMELMINTIVNYKLSDNDERYITNVVYMYLGIYIFSLIVFLIFSDFKLLLMSILAAQFLIFLSRVSALIRLSP